MIKFTRPDGVPVWINPTKVTTVTAEETEEQLEEGSEVLTAIEFEASHQIVKEPVQEVVDAIQSVLG